MDTGKLAHYKNRFHNPKTQSYMMWLEDSLNQAKAQFLLIAGMQLSKIKRSSKR